MRALVVYESMYGNTHVIAASIADGLRSTHEVTLVPAAKATRGLIADADLVVAGGPTHMHGMSRRTTRRAAAKQESGLELDPDAGGPGIREWLKDVTGGHGITAAAFDTRHTGIPFLTGRASHGIAQLLQQHGFLLLAAPESFLIGQRNTLLDDEAARARQWGATLGTTASHGYALAGT